MTCAHNVARKLEDNSASSVLGTDVNVGRQDWRVNELRAVRNRSYLDSVSVFEDFCGLAGQTVPPPWATQDTSAAGTPTLGYVTSELNGGFQLLHDATSEAQNLSLYWGDSLLIDPTKSPIVEAKLKINFAGAAFSSDQRFVIGLASARNATLDSVASNIWFRIEGTSLNILTETDDGVTDSDDVATGFAVVDNTYFTIRIDMSSLVDIKMYFNDTLVSGGIRAASALTAANKLQFFAEMQRDAGTEAEQVVFEYAGASWLRG